MKKSLLCAFSLVWSLGAQADLRNVDDEELSNVTGQSGIYLSGDITINENGGPMRNAYWGACNEAGKRCGARVAVQIQQNGGWFVLDDLRGSFSFQGLTLRSRHIDEGFGGDGAAFNNEVLEIGLPDVVRFRDVNFALGSSSRGAPSDPGFRQTDIFRVQMDGNVVTQGNLLLFPTGTP